MLYISVLITVCLAGTLQNVYAFYPNQYTAFLTGHDYTNADITEIGVLQAVAGYFETIPAPGSGATVAPGSLTGITDITARKLYDAYFGNTSSETRFQQAIDDVIRQNNKVDQDHYREAVWYVNGEQIAQAHALLTTLRSTLDQTLSAASPSYEKAREIIGQSLHIIQSFYSNSNWIEKNHNPPVTYPDFGLSGKALVTISMPSTDTCKNCGKSVGFPCFLNMVGMPTDLTSGYREGQDITKPQKAPSVGKGKCSHGGIHDSTGDTIAALGGINKETKNSDLSPHNFLHDKAGQAAIAHTKDFLVDPTHGILKAIGNSKFEELLQLRPGNSLVFVIDTSGSMSAVVSAIRTKTQEIVALTKGTALQPYNYILVTFSDPESATRMRETKNPDDLVKWVNAIQVQGGGDCPEYIMSGIKTAVVQAKPNSHIYVFTDATPKDPEQQQYILSIVSEKHLHIDFVITGSCDSSNAHFVQRRSVHAQMVQMGTGQTLGVQQSYHHYDDMIGNQTSSRRHGPTTKVDGTFHVTILQKVVGKEDSSLVEIPVDTTLSNILIKIEGDMGTPYLVIQKPNGSYLIFDGIEASENNYAGNGIELNIAKPTPGVWKVYRLDKSEWIVNVSGESTLTFSSKFAKSQAFGMGHTSTVALYDIAVGITLPEKVLVNHVELDDEYGDPMTSTMLSPVRSNGHRKSLVGQVFLTGEEYRVAIEGHDSKGYNFRRVQEHTYSHVSRRSPGTDSHRRRKRSAVTSLQNINYYKRIAQASGGHVFQTTSASIGTTVNVLKGFSSSSEVNIIRNVFKGGSTGCASISIPIDRTCKSFTLIVQGDKGLPVPLVQKPDGSTAGINGVTATKDVIGPNYVKLTYKNPVPGTWVVRRQDVNGWDMEVVAESQVDFTSRFLELGPDGYSMFEITGRPIAGDNTTISVTVNNFVNVTSLDTLVLLDRYGDELSRYPLQKRSVQKGRGVFSSSVIIPDQAFQVAVDGTDDHANPLRRVHTSLINTVAIKVQDLPIQKAFTLDEKLEIPYTITNVGGGTTMVNVTISDDQNLALRPTSQVISLMSGENSTSFFVMYADSSKVAVGTTTIITITAQPMRIIGAGFQYVVLRLTTEKKPKSKIDTIPPHCGVQPNIRGICGSDECVCAQTFVSADVTIWDEGDGLAHIDAVGIGSGNFTNTGFVLGDTKDNNTVNGTVSVDCCRKVVYINVVDNASLPTQCKIDVNPSYQNKGCNKTTIDTTPPHCANLTSIQGQCGSDDCKCSKTTLTTDYQIWDIGDGLATIDAIGVGNGSFTHTPFTKGDVKANNTVNATLSVDCCRTLVFIHILDMANLPGQCVVDVNPGYKGCNNNKRIDTTPPTCKLSNVNGQCGSDDCTCHQSTVTADVQVYDVGDGLSTIHAVGLGTGTYTRTGFTKGDTKANNTVNGTISVDCCREEAYVNVVDEAGLPAQCILQVSQNYTGCVITTPTTTSSTATTPSTTTATQTTTTPTNSSNNATTASTTTNANPSTTTTNTKATTNTKNSAKSTTVNNPGSSSSSSSSSSTDDNANAIAVAGIGLGAGIIGVAAIAGGTYLIKLKFYSGVIPG